MLEQQRIERLAPDLESHSGFVCAVVPRAWLRTGPTNSMTRHPQETGILHGLAHLDEVEERENARRQRFADAVAGKFALFQEQDAKSQFGQQIARGTPGGAGAGYHDIGLVGHATILCNPAAPYKKRETLTNCAKRNRAPRASFDH